MKIGINNQKRGCAGWIAECHLCLLEGNGKSRIAHHYGKAADRELAERRAVIALFYRTALTRYLPLRFGGDAL